LTSKYKKQIQSILLFYQKPIPEI